MNEPANEQPHREVQDDRLVSLKSLKPRAPRLDWEAIHSAQSAEVSANPRIKPSFVSLTIKGQRAVAWWSGVAAGAAISFCAMQWFVLSELKAKIERLEQSTSETERTAPGTQPSGEFESARKITVTESSFAVDLLREPTNLSVGSYRQRSDWLVALSARHPRNESSTSVSLEDSTHAQIENKSMLDHDENDPVEPPLNRLRLQKELQREIY
jgi:hypothetical protein